MGPSRSCRTGLPLGSGLRILPTMSDRDHAATDDLATTTLAEIYAQQGLYERALAIYERLADRSPDDPLVRQRIETLAEEVSRVDDASPAAPALVDTPSPGEATEEDIEFDAWLAQR